MNVIKSYSFVSLNHMTSIGPSELGDNTKETDNYQ